MLRANDSPWCLTCSLPLYCRSHKLCYEQVKQDSYSAGGLCHRESSFIQEIAQEVSLRKSTNVWVDGSLRDGSWFGKVYDDIRERFSRYRIAIFYVYASEEKIRVRVKAREKRTGRGVPEKELMDSLRAPDKSLGTLVSKVDFIARIDNNNPVPKLTSFETVDRTGSWNKVRGSGGLAAQHEL